MVTAGYKGSCIDKAVPRFAKQILVRVTDGVGVSLCADTALPGGNSSECSVHISLFTNMTNSEIRVTKQHSVLTKGNKTCSSESIQR